MKKIHLLLMLTISLFTFLGCEENEDVIAISEIDYLTFSESNYSLGIDPGGSVNLDLTVYVSNITSSDRVFSVAVDPSSNASAGSYNVPASVTIPSGTNEGTLTVALSDVDLGIGINNLIINFDLAEDQFDGGSAAIAYVQNCTEVTAVLDFMFDYWSSETDWYVYDALDGEVVSGGGYADGIGTASETITLCSGRDYTLVVTDFYEDGMNDGVNPLGVYTLTIGGVVKVTGGGNFGASESSAFDTN